MLFIVMNQIKFRKIVIRYKTDYTTHNYFLDLKRTHSIGLRHCLLLLLLEENHERHNKNLYILEFDIQIQRSKLHSLLQMRELNCLASLPIFSRTIPLPWDEPTKEFFHSLLKWDFLYDILEISHKLTFQKIFIIFHHIKIY